MSAEENTIINDQREIYSIDFNDEQGSCYSTDLGCKIEAYGEPGMHCYIPFYRVIREGKIIARVPAWQVSVRYKDTP